MRCGRTIMVPKYGGASLVQEGMKWKIPKKCSNCWSERSGECGYAAHTPVSFYIFRLPV